MTDELAGVLALARPEIRTLTPYAHASWAPQLTRLHANELPWANNSGAGPALNRYPEPQPAELLAALAQYFGLTPKQVLATHGSDEAIDILTRAFCRAGQDAVIITPPSFGMFAVAARVQGAEVIEVALRADADFALDADALCQAINPKVKIVWLCSPNNPTGACLRAAEVLKVIDATRGRALLVIDEAYAEFSEQASWLRLLPRNPHLAILRTLSKAHGLAGARIGALLAHADIVALLRKIILPYTLSTDSVASAIAALQPAALAQTRDRVQQIIAARNRLALDLKASSAVLQVWPSDANFLLARCQPGTRLYERWIDAGLLVRDFRHAPALSDCLRVTVGDDAQNDRLRAVLGSTS